MRQRSLLILSALGILFASCGNKAGKSGLLVPKDASIVVHINSSSLSSKISWEEMRQTNWFKEMSKEATDSLSQQLLANPASSGIDTKDDFVFYLKKQGRGGYLVFEGSLSNAATYEKLLAQLSKDDPKEIKKDGEYSYMESGKGSVVIWTKSMFALVANGNVPGMKGPLQGNRDEYEDRHEFGADSLRIFGKQALTLKNSDNLDGDSRFASLVKDGSDIHVWVNMAKDYSSMGPMLSMMKLNVLFEDNVSATSLNFDNGKISAKTKQYYGEEMTKLLSKYKPEPVSAELINRIPSQNVTGVLAFNYPPKGLQEFLKVLGVDGLANGYLSQVNYSVEEFIKANKGEVLIAVSDLGFVTKLDTVNYEKSQSIYPSRKTDMKVLFATAVNDKAAFEKLVTLGWESSKKFMGKMPEISYKLENNWFAASNSSEQTDKFLAGGNSKHSFADKISGHPMGAYLDLQKLIGTVGSFLGEDSSGRAGLDATRNMWQDITATGGDYNDKAIEFEFEVNLVDKTTNSLKQLNQYFDKLSTIRQSRHKGFVGADMDENHMMDSLVVAPPAVK